MNEVGINEDAIDIFGINRIGVDEAGAGEVEVIDVWFNGVVITKVEGINVWRYIGEA